MDAIGKLSAGAAAVSGAVSSLNHAAERMAGVADQLAGLEIRAANSAQAVAQASTGLGAATQAMSNSMAHLTTTTARLETVGKAMSSEVDARKGLLRDLHEIISRTTIASEQFVGLQRQVEETLSATIEKFGSESDAF